MRAVTYATMARQDIDEAVAFVAAENPVAAGRLIERIDDVAGKLLAFPQLGSELTSRLRIMTVGGTPFRVIYRPSRRGITILRIWHGARGWPPASS